MANDDLAVLSGVEMRHSLGSKPPGMLYRIGGMLENPVIATMTAIVPETESEWHIDLHFRGERSSLMITESPLYRDDLHIFHVGENGEIAQRFDVLPVVEPSRVRCSRKGFDQVPQRSFSKETG